MELKNIHQEYEQNPGTFTATREDTPDGPLHTFEWIGGEVIVIAMELLCETPDLFLILPWELECLGRHPVTGDGYYRRLT